MASFDHSRRDFLRTSLLGGAAALATPWLGQLACAEGAPRARRAVGVASAASFPPGAAPARVALTTGTDRADMTFRALRQFEKEIAGAIGDKRVILKPNNVSTSTPLCATHADNLEAILEFLRSIGKRDVVIAESCGGGSALDGFANYGYNRVASKYGAKLVDLDQEAYELVPCIDERDLRPRATRVSKLLTDRNNYIISATKPKTHDTVVATLSLKNIVMAAPLKGEVDGRYRSDKRLVHGGGVRGINFNLASLAPRLHPDLAVIDGYEGMEGNGPIGGTRVDHRICLVSQDWLAADRVAIELMGIDFANVGYLNYCAQYGGMGEANLERIEVLGPALKDHVRKYRLADNIDWQLHWMQPVPRG